MNYKTLYLENAENLEEVTTWMDSKVVKDQIRSIISFQILPRKDRFSTYTDRFGTYTYDCVVVGEINYDNTESRRFLRSMMIGESN